MTRFLKNIVTTSFIRNIANYFSPSSIKLREATTIIPLINSKEEEYIHLTHEQIILKTREFQERYKKGATLDSLLVEAFALVREGAKRSLYQRPYDVQMIGAFILHNRMIAEMYTGEGKTLVAVIAAYLNGLTGKGVQVVTVNDYLAKRDSEETGKVLKYLGLTVGLVQEGLTAHQKQEQYNKDVTYVSNHEVAFDYLRDNMEMYPENQVMINRINYCIVDEVDSILLDEARTPLIISGTGDKSSDLYKVLTPIVQKLDPKIHLEFDEFKTRAELTEVGMDFIEDELCKAGILKPLDNILDDDTMNIHQGHRIYNELYEPKNLLINHYINQIIRANFIMKVDVDYIVSKQGEVIIIDQNTGRLGFGRRFSDGLHQALEAKENVEVKEESITLATTTYQSFFQLFQLAGMTGTAKEAEEEFIDVYNIEVVPIPTNRPSKKIVHKDILFFKNDARIDKVNEIVMEKHKKGQPILIITLSVNDSEVISRALTKKKIPHNLLNAKNHEEEANIIREAGKFGSVTVATDIAGRGTDVQLGGSRSHIISVAQENNASEEEIAQLMEKLSQDKAQVSELGGLCVICIGRHESERLDNQASGRCGRQGERGEVFFLLSLEDELIQNTMGNSSFQQWSLSEILESGDNYVEGYMVDTLINTIQKSKSLLSYESRKNLYKYDKIIDIQRKIIYKIRNNLLNTPLVVENFNEKNQNINKSYFFQMGQKIVVNIIEKILFSIDYTSSESIAKAREIIYQLFNLSNEITIENNDITNVSDNILINNIAVQLSSLYQKKLDEKVSQGSTLETAQFFKGQLISICDKTIQKYLQAIADSKDGSYLSSYAQKDPLNEFNKKMMGILSDFFFEWQKSFVESIFYDVPVAKRNFMGGGASELGSMGSSPEELFSMEELENFLKENPHLQKNINLTPEEEQERVQLRSEINALLLDHLKNSGSIEYSEEHEDEKNVISYSPDQDAQELMETLHLLSENMDLNQLKELKQDLITKIHHVRDYGVEESPEYQDTVFNEIQGITNFDNVVGNLESILQELTPEEWEALQKYLVEEINSMTKEENGSVDHVQQIMAGEEDVQIQNLDEDLREEIGDILEDIQDIINNTNTEDGQRIKNILIKKIDELTPDN
jgi:preprotein translocase subunit SecA